MKIDLLYFEGCPSWQQGVNNLRSALAQQKVEAEIRLLRVESDEAAELEKFLGSPSFRVNGQDLWQEDRQHYHLGCRVYPTPDGMRGAPTVEMLRDKIRNLSMK